MAKYPYFSLAIALFWTSAVAARTPDNMQFSASITDSAVSRFFGDATVIKDWGFQIHSLDPHPLNFLVEQSLVDFIREGGGNVYLDLKGDSGEARKSDYICDYKILAYNLSYLSAPKPHQKGKKVWRRGELAAIFRLVSIPDGEVVKTQEISTEKSDYIGSREAALFSSSGNFYLRPQVADGSFKRYVEPVLVGATVATLIGLFFSNR